MLNDNPIDICLSYRNDRIDIVLSNELIVDAVANNVSI